MTPPGKNVFLKMCEILYSQKYPTIIVSLSPPTRLKLSPSNRLELCVGNEVLRASDDKKLVSSIPLRDRMVCTRCYSVCM